MVESLEHRTQDNRQFIETAWTKFERRMRYISFALIFQFCASYLIFNRGIRLKTLESNDGSFILKEMITAYRAAASFKGRSHYREFPYT